MERFSRFIRTFGHSIVLFLALALTTPLGACSSEKKDLKDYRNFLGEESYDSGICAMCVEKIEGEEEEGVIYRKVENRALLKTKEIPLVLYFYSSASSDRAGITAGVEDIAQRLSGRCLIVAVDIMRNRDLVTEYEMEYVPDFVLIRDGKVDDRFDAVSREYWTATDVYNWLILDKI